MHPKMVHVVVKYVHKVCYKLNWTYKCVWMCHKKKSLHVFFMPKHESDGIVGMEQPMNQWTSQPTNQLTNQPMKWCRPCGEIDFLLQLEFMFSFPFQCEICRNILEYFMFRFRRLSGFLGTKYQSKDVRTLSQNNIPDFCFCWNRSSSEPF